MRVRGMLTYAEIFEMYEDKTGEDGLSHQEVVGLIVACTYASHRMIDTYCVSCKLALCDKSRFFTKPEAITEADRKWALPAIKFADIDMDEAWRKFTLPWIRVKATTSRIRLQSDS